MGEASSSAVLVEDGSSLDLGMLHGERWRGLRESWEKVSGLVNEDWVGSRWGESGRGQEWLQLLLQKVKAVCTATVISYSKMLIIYVEYYKNYLPWV